MNDAARRARNDAMLAQMHPVARARMRQLLTQLESEGWRPRSQQTWRSPIEQHQAFVSGHSDVEYGLHNCTTPVGLPDALADDLVDDDSPLSPQMLFIQRVNELVGRYNLMTGILWSSRKAKRPLTDIEKARIMNACSTGDWTLVKRIGFDPLHVQVKGISTLEAKAGMRPQA